ncbi:MAG: nucleoside phosphorylase [Flavobacteriales bacterium]|nr:nucleoside phosphorylase [Flavobacteriales bacterium]MCB9168234.1 nucleoside phosphorylase [Flavobacteriales bacterium]
MRAKDLTPPGTRLADSELALNADGSVYHLALRPEQLADTVLIAGDPGRIERISGRFETVEHRSTNREFVAHTGTLRGHRLTALSTGIGTDNIDIVLNELDVLANVDIPNRTPKATQRSLRIVRLGTCGSLQPDIPVDGRVVSRYGLGLDNVLHFYASEPDTDELAMLEEFLRHTDWTADLPTPYIAKADAGLVDLLGEGNHVGITATASGFYGPQGRRIRATPRAPGINKELTAFRHEGLRVLNYEMETSALYGLSALLGHKACTICTVVANRSVGSFSKDHHAAVDRLIDEVLLRIAP